MKGKCMVSDKLKARRDFFWYLYKVDLKHRRNVNSALLGFGLTMVSLWIGLGDTIDFNFSGITGLTLTAFSVIGATWSVFSTYKNLRSFDADDTHEEYHALTRSDIPVEGSSEIKLSDLMPSERDLKHGFHAVEPEGSTEVAHTSGLLNDWLSEQPAISCERPHGRKNLFTRRFARDTRLRDRLTYLRILVRTKNARNEQKYRIAGIEPGSKTVSLEKVGYYDAIMSNQLVSTEIMRRPVGTRQTGLVASDLRSLFPVSQEYDANGAARFRLCELADDLLLANSVGITTLALTRDRFPVIFNQKLRNIEGSGTLTLAGSGSADFSDLKSGSGGQLLNALKYGMVRELLEEGHITCSARDLKSLRKDAVEKTLVTGFFRWVRRGGKPEFLGVTRLGINFSEIEADNLEVAPLLKSSNLRITRMHDFSQLAISLTEEKADERRMALSLSSAMAIWRLARISEGKTSADADMRERIASILDINAC